MEHIIVVLFGQSFLFFMLLVTQALDKLGEIFTEYYPDIGIIHVFLSIIVALSFLWIPVYLYLTQKRVYGQSTSVTLIKFFIICTVYFMLLVFTLLIAVIWNIVTL